MNSRSVPEGMPRRWPTTLLATTLALGATVALSWILVGGTAAWQGPDRVLQQDWPLIYGLQALLAALVGLWVGRRAPGVRGIAVLLLAAWLGELVALTLFGNLLANEIDPEVAWVFWRMGTGGPLQPLAALIGAVVGRSARKLG